jgi:hypothetical protein
VDAALIAVRSPHQGPSAAASGPTLSVRRQATRTSRGSDGEQQRAATDDYCEVCFVKKAVFLLECCNKPVCNFCLRDFVRNPASGYHYFTRTSSR